MTRSQRFCHTYINRERCYHRLDQRPWWIKPQGIQLCNMLRTNE